MIGLKFWTKSHLVLIAVLAGVGCDQLDQKEDSIVLEPPPGGDICVCSNYMALQSSTRPYDAAISGAVHFDPVPLSMEGAIFHVFVDEIEPEGDGPRRIIEKTLSLAELSANEVEKIEDLGECGTDGGEPANALPYSTCTCSSDPNYAYLSSAAEAREPVIHGSIAANGDVAFNIEFTIPDHRSNYQLGFFVDMDGDGVTSSGDYITREEVLVATHGNPSDVHVKVERVDGPESPLVTVHVETDPETSIGPETLLTVELIDLADADRTPILSESKKIANPDDWTVNLYGVLTAQLVEYGVIVRLDLNGDGIADNGDLTTTSPIHVLTFGHPAEVDVELTLPN